ncbi:hypothetical protein QF001_000928 [Paraburkholderia youngii]|uniref:hypothetical protein n=1 Tax=Paraburkholderia youngii TaxID=2782701 RepID=UPI003D1AB553
MNIRKYFVAIFAALMLCVGSTVYGALPAIAPTGQAQLAVSTTSANVAWPTTGTPTQIVVTNMGPLTAFVQLGNSSVTASATTGMPVLPYSSVVLTVGANTNIAAITQGSSTVIVITAGT